MIKSRALRKNKQFEVLAELYNLRFINRSLTFEISENIETVNAQREMRKLEDNLEFLGDYQTDAQMEVF